MHFGILVILASCSFYTGLLIGLTSTESVPPLPANRKVDEWIKKLCSENKDPVCHHVIVLFKRKVSFCSAAKVASTTTYRYFFDISDGEVVIPKNARYGAHEANWTRLGSLDHKSRQNLLSSPSWTRVVFLRNVVERFISGYLDKVVNDCRRFNDTQIANSHLATSFYYQYGFSCEKHRNLESFLSFMETVPRMEGHFSPQSPLCNIQKFPHTDIIMADENLDTNLQHLSKRLNVYHPQADNKTSSHAQGAKTKMRDIFRGRRDLVDRILKLFDEDCISYPKACIVEEF